MAESDDARQNFVGDVARLLFSTGPGDFKLANSDDRS
jgi:hypothetical protein